MKLELQVMAYMRCHKQALTEQVAEALGRSIKAVYLCLRRLAFQGKVARLGRSVNNVMRWQIIKGKANV